jgi:hypothetical protein
MNAAEIACALGDARRPGRVWRCLCPLHGGHSLLRATAVKFNLTMAAYNLVAQVAQLTRITGRRHPMGSIPAKLAITNSSSPGLNHITASLARIFSGLLPN